MSANCSLVLSHPRSRNLLGRVDDLWLKADDLKFDTESDISDVSEIWSEYGDRVCPDSQPKMVRWNQGQEKKGKVREIPAINFSIGPVPKWNHYGEYPQLNYRSSNPFYYAKVPSVPSLADF